MVLMDSVVPHDLFDPPYDDPAALLRCAGIGSDRIRSDWNRIDDVDERHVAGRNVTFGRPCSTLVMLATPGWCHVPYLVDGHSLRGIVHIMLGSK